MCSQLKRVLVIPVTKLSLPLARIVCQPSHVMLTQNFKYAEQEASRPARRVNKSKFCHFLWILSLNQTAHRSIHNEVNHEARRVVHTFGLAQFGLQFCFDLVALYMDNFPNEPLIDGAQ